MPAAIGNALVSSVARPTVASAPPRWNPACKIAVPAAVEDDQADQERAVRDPAGDGRLRRDVPGRKEDTCRDSPGRPSADHAGEHRHAHPRAAHRGEEPDRYPQVVGTRALAVSNEQAGPEQREARDRQARADPLSRRQRDVRETGDHDREDADTRRGGRLHERQRRQRERADVEEPTDRLGCEAREPAPIAQQRGQRRERPPQREPRLLRGNAVPRAVPRLRRQAETTAIASAYPTCISLHPLRRARPRAPVPAPVFSEAPHLPRP
jgi:hypothetical protein